LIYHELSPKTYPYQLRKGGQWVIFNVQMLRNVALKTTPFLVKVLASC